jgi:hypothetical protein
MGVCGLRACVLECVCARAHLCAFAGLSLRARMCIRACACACMRSCERAREVWISIGKHLRACVFVCMRMWSDCACAPLGCAGAVVARRGPAVFTDRPAARAAARAWLHLVRSAGVSRAVAAGVRWTNRTTSAPWDGRRGHTSVIDAAGAIYVIGGSSLSTYYRDVWASTDGGARAGLGRGWSGVLVWFSRA